MQPPIDQSIYEELMAQQGQTQQDKQVPQGEPTQPTQPVPQPELQPMQPTQPAPQMQQPQQVQPEPQPMQPEPDELEQAKKLLGLDAVEQELKELKMEKTKQVLSSKYPDVPFELVEKEIEKVKAVNPALAESMLTNPDAMELAYKAATASMLPKEKPDEILEGQGGGAADDNMEERIAKGEADDFTLGEYILGAKGQ